LGKETGVRPLPGGVNRGGEKGSQGKHHYVVQKVSRVMTMKQKIKEKDNRVQGAFAHRNFGGGGPSFKKSGGERTGDGGAVPFWERGRAKRWPHSLKEKGNSKTKSGKI